MELEHLVAMSSQGDPRLSRKGTQMAINIFSHVSPEPPEVRGILLRPAALALQERSRIQQSGTSLFDLILQPGWITQEVSG